MTIKESAAQQFQPQLATTIALAAAVITACPSTPTPYAPWIWGAVVVVVLVVALTDRAKQSQLRLA
ncbi:hypothetical protein GCM10023100_57080 [Actinocorallia cavernae]|uniref:Lipoprotein n=2 Tax=Actinomycetes TaxID=1760 RepID=A0ABN3MQ35_9ACTN